MINDTFNELLQGLEEKFTPSEVLELIQVKSPGSNNHFHSACINEKDDIFEKMARIARNHQLPEKMVIEFLFAINYESKQPIQCASESGKLTSLIKFFEITRMSPNSVVEVMSRLTIFSKSLSDSGFTVDVNQQDEVVVERLSWWAKHLLRPVYVRQEGKTIAKELGKPVEVFLADLQKHVKENPELDPSWMKVYRILKSIHEKKNGLTSIRLPQISQFADSEKPSVSPQRLQLHEVKR
jgi:hypothetical protein